MFYRKLIICQGWRIICSTLRWILILDCLSSLHSSRSYWRTDTLLPTGSETYYPLMSTRARIYSTFIQILQLLSIWNRNCFRKFISLNCKCNNVNVSLNGLNPNKSLIPGFNIKNFLWNCNHWSEYWFLTQLSNLGNLSLFIL